MPISEQEQVDQRRTLVWKLYSRGYTQQEIANYLEENHYPTVSRRQIGYDIEWHRKEATNFIKENRRMLAEEYKRAHSNLEDLRTEAWRQFEAITDPQSTVKTSLYDKIQSLTNNIMTLFSVGDTIEQELLKNMQAEAEDFRKELEKINDQRIAAQAVF